jgi:hypothetical protein
MPLLLRGPPFPPPGPPLPAHGGRSLIVRAWGDVLPEFEPPGAGRSPMLRGEFCAGAFAGRLESPKPCGARPRSVALPCASQVRPLPARARLLFAAGPFAERLPFGIAEGGRFCESSRCRPVTPELPEFAGALPGRFSNWPLVLMLLCAPELPAWPLALAAPSTPPLTLAAPPTCAPPKRPALIAPFIVRTDS